MKTKYTFLVVFFSIISLSTLAQSADQELKITGVIIDDSNTPLPGINIIEKGTNNGTATDFDGNYEITVSSGAILVYSYVGFKTTEKLIENAGTVNITMKESSESLDEVVVVGYGTQKREALTGAVETIQGEEIEDLPVGDLASALIGRVLGVGVSGGQTRPGQAAQITIRNPLSGNNIRAKDAYSTDPLYVIDGVVQIDPNTGFSDPTYFNTLDASQIESISFLKDASAAIYGSRAAQGVVLVTTKQGKKGPARFSYSGNYSVADETYRVDVLDAYEYGRTINILNTATGQAYDPENPVPVNRNLFFSPTELEHFKTLNYDALDDYWKAAFTQRHNLTLSGGSDDATYFGGVSYFKQDGNLGTLDYDRWSFRAGVNVNLAKGFKADFQVNGYFTSQSRTASSIGNQNPEDDFRQLQNQTPFMPLFVKDLPAVLIGSESADEIIGFHYGELQRLQNLSKTDDSNVGAIINLQYEVPFIEGLRFQLNYARSEGGGRGSQIGSKYTLYQFFGADSDPSDGSNIATPGQEYVVYESGSGPLGTNSVRLAQEIVNNDRLLIDNTRNGNQQIRFQTFYEGDFGKHSVSAMAAVERAERFFNSERIVKYGVPEWSDGMLWQTTGDLDSETTYNRRGESGDLGYIGRLNYNYDDTYFGQVLYRSDASAKFSPDNYWGNFYTFSAGWIASNESFFNSKIVDYLKLRASVGVVGKDDIKPWQWRQNYDFRVGEGAVFGGNLSATDGLRDSGQANEDLRWGQELKTNFGADLKLFDNRLSLTSEIFFNYGTKLLVNLNTGVPFSVGGSTAPSNAGRANTWGQEFGVGWDDSIGDFSYGANVNIGWYNNDIIDGNFSNSDFWYPWQPNKPGSSDVGTWGYDYLGMFRTQADIDNYLADTGVTSILGVNQDNLQPGMLYYRDVRGQWDPATRTFGPKDGIIDKNDQVQLQKPARGPQGLSAVLNFGYKGLRLNTVLSVNWAGYNGVGSAKDPLNSSNIQSNYENRPAFWANMYHPTLNPTGTIPNLERSINGGTDESEGGINTVRSEFWRVSSFSVLVRNINLSYAIPNDLVKRIGLNSVRLNLVGLNPFLLSNPYKDYGLSPYSSYNSYPVLSTYSLGLSIGF